MRRIRLNYEQLKSKAYDKDYVVKENSYHGTGGYHSFWTDMYNFSQVEGFQTFDEFVKNPKWYTGTGTDSYSASLAENQIMSSYNTEFNRAKGRRATHNQYGWKE
tara:strand:- start:130 stop:444 length:315 start_codon:yes stop_codon:yes gene_type:complete